jgi:hypothetical protein
VKFAILVMTDGRAAYLRKCLTSAYEHLLYDYGLQPDQVAELWMHDDTGDDEYRARLAAEYPGFEQIGRGPRRGFGGAIQRAWRVLAARSSADYVFHLEQDFVLTRSVDLDAMAEVLQNHPSLMQLALRRQPWNEAERAAGGIVEQHPDDYREVEWRGHAWLEHRRFFTTNPSLYRRSLCSLGWPTGAQSEGRFGLSLFWYGDKVCGFWGARDSGEWVEHIGHERVGVGY